MDGARIGVVIADDEDHARARLRTLLEGEPDMELLGEAANGLDALRLIVTGRPELVFLDVQMPDLDGIGVVEALPGEETPEVIFVTAFHEFMERAFELHAVDYLRKPYTNARFASALEHARRRIRGRRLERGAAPPAEAEEPAPSRFTPVLASIRERRPARRLALPDPGTGDFVMVDVEHIDRVQANRNEGVLLYLGGRAVPWRKSLSEVEGILDPELFARVHRSHIVNVSRIERIAPLFRGEYAIVLRDGTRVETGRSYEAVVRRLLGARG